MVRIEIPTAISQLISGDVVWHNDQAHTVTALSTVDGTTIVTVRDETGMRRNLFGDASTTIARQARS